MTKSRFPLRAAVAAILAAAAGLVVWQLRETLPDPASKSGEADAAAVPPPSMVPFMTAPSPEARAALVTGGSARWQEQITARYRGGDPDNLSPGAFQESAEGPEAGLFGPVRTLTAAPGRGLPEVMACFRQENGRGPWLLDWPLYQQTLTDSVGRFAAEPAAGGQVLRVRLVRGEAEARTGTVMISEPFQPRTVLTLSADRSDLTSLFDAELPAGAPPRPATIVAAWVHPPDGGPLRAILRRHICWGFEGLNAAPPALPVPEAEALAISEAAAALGTRQAPSALSLRPAGTSEGPARKPVARE